MAFAIGHGQWTRCMRILHFRLPVDVGTRDMNSMDAFRTAPGVNRRDLGRRRRHGSAVRRMAGLSVAIVGIALGGCVPQQSDVPIASDAQVGLNPTAPFSVGVVPNRAPPVRIGDELGFILSANTAGYGHVYLLTASGGVLVLGENLPVAANQQTVFPTPGGSFTFRATPPAGMERIIFMVTRQPFKGFGGGASGPVQRAMQPDDFLDDLNDSMEQLPENGWALAETRVEIVP